MPLQSHWTSGSRIRRVLIVTIAAVILALVVRISFVGVLRERQPEAALTWWGSDSGANARQAFELVVKGGKPEVLTRARAGALAALRRSPVNVEAVRTLGFIAEVERNEVAAARLFKHAERLSRRDRLTQLWFIEYYSRKGDIGRTLHHYDTTLRTSRESRALLFPVLIQASSNPELSGPISDLLATRPLQWWIDFAMQLIDEGRNPTQIAAILNPVLDPRDPLERDLVGKLIGRLAGAGSYDLAWTTYANAMRRAGSQLPRTLVRDGDFSAKSIYPPLEWQLVSEPDLYASLGSRPDRESDNMLELTALNGRSGEVARQLLYLPAGSYLLTFEAGEKPSDWSGQVVVSVLCARKDGSQLVSLSAYDRGGRQGLRSGGFTVASGCAAQWLSIRTASDGSPPSSAPWIDRIQIRAAAGGVRSNQPQG